MWGLQEGGNPAQQRFPNQLIFTWKIYFWPSWSAFGLFNPFRLIYIWKIPKYQPLTGSRNGHEFLITSSKNCFFNHIYYIQRYSFVFFFFFSSKLFGVIVRFVGICKKANVVKKFLFQIWHDALHFFKSILYILPVQWTPCFEKATWGGTLLFCTFCLVL